MKKRCYVAATVSALALAITACGGGSGKENTEAETTVESTVEQESQVEETEGDTQEESETAETEAEAEITQEDITTFAEEVEGVVMNKDLEGLADMISFPVYVASVTENEGIVENKEAFLAIGQDKLFVDAFVDVITSFDVTGLEASEAGYVIGNETPNIIFNIGEDGNLGITGINNQ
ncbi:hypothetical protein AALB16_14025 [Lachnospiraceae bacterium 62-35]